MKRVLIVSALMLLPTAAMAQQHEHAQPHAAKPAAAEHANFAKELIAAKADLKLTDDQIKKLEALSVRMDEHHKNMGAHHSEHAKTGDEAAKMEGKIHADLLAIFTEEQLVKVRPMMKAHHEGMKPAKPEHKH
jgi:hypothetical protein